MFKMKNPLVVHFETLNCMKTMSLNFYSVYCFKMNDEQKKDFAQLRSIKIFMN